MIAERCRKYETTEMASGWWRGFSVSDHLAEKYPPDPAWEVWKERGTKALQAKDYRTAERCYAEAGWIALGPMEGNLKKMFCEALMSWPEGSPQRRLVADDDLVMDIMRWLPRPAQPVKWTPKDGSNPVVYEMPNKAAAIAFANQSAALMHLEGEGQSALNSAEFAVRLNPSYVKAHYRKMKALEKLGRREEAAVLAEEIKEYEESMKQVPTEELALLQCEWIELQEAMVLFGRVRFHAAVEHIQEKIRVQDGARDPLQMGICLVPTLGGQGLMVSVSFPVAYPTVAFMEQLEYLRFVLVDYENEARLRSLYDDDPPKKSKSKTAASKRTLECVPKVVLATMTQLADDSGYSVGKITVGLGLDAHVGLLEKHLRQNGQGHVTVELQPWPGSPEEAEAEERMMHIEKRMEEMNRMLAKFGIRESRRG